MRDRDLVVREAVGGELGGRAEADVRRVQLSDAPDPARCPEAIELDRLLERQERLAGRISEVEREQRAAGEAVAIASDRVADLERRAG